MIIIEYTNIGRRAQNQDFVLSKKIGGSKALYIVADGMGGYSDGSIAAKIAAEEIANFIIQGKSIPESVLNANAELSRAIRERGVSKMGCCFAGIEVDGYIGNIFLDWRLPCISISQWATNLRYPRSYNDCGNGETW